MFIDHQALISLMKDKELSRRQMRWVQKLADFNFRIMYWSDKQNIKINALTRRADVVLRDSEDERVRYQQITILTSNWMKIANLKKNISESIYKQILETNEIDENCMLLREAIARDETQYKDIKLKNCQTQNEILYHDSQLWVSFNELLQMNLIREMHDQSSVDHSDILRTVKVIRLIASSQVLEFVSSTRLEKCQVELKFFWKSIKSSWEVELKNLSQIEKLDLTIRFENSTRLDKILDRCK